MPGGIDKSCGEIEKKYWTETRYGFTLNSESFAWRCLWTIRRKLFLPLVILQWI